MASLAEQLRSLTNPEPSRFDLDEDEFDLTKAQVINKGSDLGDIKNQIESNASNLRKKTVPLLQDEDKKYAGRKISRADLEASRGYIDGSYSEAESDIASDSEGEVQTGKGMPEAEKELEDEDGVNAEHDFVDGDDDDHVSDDFGSDDENDYDNFDNEDDNDSSEIVVNGADDINDEDDNDDEMEGKEGANENAIQSFSAATLTEDIEKGKAAKNQLNLWDSFLEMRIRLQKALMIANRLPQEDQLAEFNSFRDKNLKEVYKQGKKSIAKLLGNLLWMQEKLMGQNPDTANILHPGTESKTTAQGSDNDEEIPSDTEDEKSDDGDEEANEAEEEVEDEVDEAIVKDHTTRDQAKNTLKLPAKRKHDLATQEFAEYISKRHAAFTSYRDATISKWSEKTRLASGKFNSKSFSSFDRSAIAQINHILSDKGRLIKRTQLKRTSYRVLGKSEENDEQNTQSSEERSDLHLKDYDPEIFDDDDFYHQLLRDFIEQKTSGSTDNPVEMGRQWLELQKLRRKVKKKVDIKASKGRKIRYDVHGKLVSFMAPIEKGNMTDSSRNELFSSLFGAKQQDQAVDMNVFS